MAANTGLTAHDNVDKAHAFINEILNDMLIVICCVCYVLCVIITPGRLDVADCDKRSK